MDLAPDFDEFVASLTVHGVEFLIVGAARAPHLLHFSSVSPVF
jgi:hypothetical protein